MIERVRRRLRPWLTRVLPAVLVATAVANVAFTPFVPAQSQPIRFHADGSLRGLIASERESVTVRYSIYEDLRLLAADGTLVVPAGRRILDEYLVGGMSLMSVEVIDYDPETSVAGAAAATGPSDATATIDSYTILAGDADRWWVAIDGSTLVIVPESVAPIPESAG